MVFVLYGCILAPASSGVSWYEDFWIEGWDDNEERITAAAARLNAIQRRAESIGPAEEAGAPIVYGVSGPHERYYEDESC